MQPPVSHLCFLRCSYFASKVPASFCLYCSAVPPLLSGGLSYEKHQRKKYLRGQKSSWTACWNHTLLFSLPLDSAWILVIFQKRGGPFQALAMFLMAKITDNGRYLSSKISEMFTKPKGRDGHDEQKAVLQKQLQRRESRKEETLREKDPQRNVPSGFYKF